MAAPKDDECKDCKFYDKDVCRRYPPTPIWDGHEMRPYYPSVIDQKACGEFLKKK